MIGVFNSTKRPNAVRPPQRNVGPSGARPWPNAVRPYKAPAPCPVKSFSSTIRHGTQDTGHGIRDSGSGIRAKWQLPHPPRPAIKPRSPGAPYRPRLVAAQQAQTCRMSFSGCSPIFLPSFRLLFAKNLLWADAGRCGDLWGIHNPFGPKPAFLKSHPRKFKLCG